MAGGTDKLCSFQARGKGASVMQPLRPPASGAAPPPLLGSAAFEAMAEADVPPEAVFLHRFAALRAGAGKKGKKAKKKGGEDGLSDSEGEGDSGSDAEIGAISLAVLCGQHSYCR